MSVLALKYFGMLEQEEQCKQAEAGQQGVAVAMGGPWLQGTAGVGSSVFAFPEVGQKWT